MAHPILLAGFGAARKSDPPIAHEVLATIAAGPAAHSAQSVRTLSLPALWSGSAEHLAREAHAVGAAGIVLLANRPSLEAIGVAAQAQNCADPIPDRSGIVWPGREIAPGASKTLCARDPGAAILAALQGADLAAQWGPDHPADWANLCLYRTLVAAGGLPCALIGLPCPMESARFFGVRAICPLNRAQLLLAVELSLDVLRQRTLTAHGARRSAGPV